MVTRREFTIGAGAALALGAPGARAEGEAERNKKIVLDYRAASDVGDAASVQGKFMAPGYKRLRGGALNLAANAEGQGFPSSGDFLRGGIPDRKDVVEEIIGDGDKVGMLWRITGTHKGPLFGIAATGKPVDVYELGIFRLADGKIAEAWFMMDEAGLLMQLGAKLPPRKDGSTIAPAITDDGEDGDIVLKRLMAEAPQTAEGRNKVIVARSKSSSPNPQDRTPDHRQKRFGLQHLHDYGDAHGTAAFAPGKALPGRQDHVKELLAEADKVWMRFYLRGTQTGNLYGIAPTGKRVEMPEVGIMKVVDGKWVESWYFGDELGLLLQLGAPNLLLS